MACCDEGEKKAEYPALVDGNVAACPACGACLTLSTSFYPEKMLMLGRCSGCGYTWYELPEFAKAKPRPPKKEIGPRFICEKRYVVWSKIPVAEPITGVLNIAEESSGKIVVTIDNPYRLPDDMCRRLMDDFVVSLQIEQKNEVCGR